MPPSRKRAQTDAILSIKCEYMDQIVNRQKTFEFRGYLINPSVQRIWFYLNAPQSHIAYICEIDPARTRKEGDEPLPEDGLGNKEFNSGHKDWEKYGYAYRIRNVRRLKSPVSLVEMRELYGIKSAPRSLVYVPERLLRQFSLPELEELWSIKEPREGTQETTITSTTRKRKLSVSIDEGKERPFNRKNIQARYAPVHVKSSSRSTRGHQRVVNSTTATAPSKPRKSTEPAGNILQ